MVLLVTSNVNETLATYGFLQPLDGHKNIYNYFQCTSQGRKSYKVAIYYIGKYGSCPAAIRNVTPGFEAHDSVSMMANQCFPNLCAIISVGVCCGITKAAKLCDVFVSSKIGIYNKVQDEHEPKGESITASPQLMKLFTQFNQWPNDEIKKRLNNNGLQIPDVKDGVILCGPYLVDDPMRKTLLNSFDPEVMGIEMEKTYLFTDTQQIMANTIIIKAVCDFGDGKYNETCQPTAALIAADLVHKSLSHPNAHKTFKGL